MIEKPQLRNPILVEGLPGIGFVANIACLHLIRELKAKCFCKIYSPHFQAVSLTNESGGLRPPVNELYAANVQSAEHDLIILYGNTQAHSSDGQYELCDRILTVVRELGCQSVITIGGLKTEYPVASPSVYCTATDREILEKGIGLGAKQINGRVFGAAGVLLGVAQTMKMTGLCVLADTLGIYPDAPAAKVALDFLSRYIGLQIASAQLDAAVRVTREMLQSLISGHTVDSPESTAPP